VHIDLANLTAGQTAIITATASLMAAVLVGTFALVVALVNAWSARRMVRATSLREFRLKLFEPFMTTLSTDLYWLQQTSETFPGLSDQLLRDGLNLVGSLQKRQRVVALAQVYGHAGTSTGLQRAVEAYVKSISELDAAAAPLSLFLTERFTDYHDKNWVTLPGADQMRRGLVPLIPPCIASGFRLRNELDKFIFG
jgi:hypothetical protein